MSKVFLLLGMAAVLTACGDAKPAGNLAQDITMGSGQGNAGKESGGENGGEQETEASDQEKQKEEEGVFSFVYEGVTLISGDAFDRSLLPGYTEVSEIPSCAFDGSDNEYNYEVFALTAHIEEEGERIYSIYFIDPNLPTTEGLCLGDTVEDMISYYGEGYATDANAYVYTRGDTLLCIITQNDVVTSIEYRLDK